MKKVLFYKAFIKEASLVFIIFYIVFPPFHANASVFGLFLKTQAANDLIDENSNVINSQKLKVLEPVTSIDPKINLEREKDVYIDNSALVSEMGPLGTALDVDDVPLTDEISIYVTRKGDTISTVADLFDVSINTIIWANNLTRGQSLAEGQTLIILPVSGVNHTIRKGETLKSIASRYRADIGDIESFNGITMDTPLVVGETIIIPDGEMSSNVDSSKKVSARKTTRKERTYNTNGPTVSGYFINPVPLARMSQNLHANNGIDLAAPTGTPIYASAGGTVLISRASGYNGGFGKFVVINHPNGTQTLYAHMSRVVAAQGSSVSQGEVIGYVGSTGKSTGPHLHFEVHGAKNPGSNHTWAQ